MDKIFPYTGYSFFDWWTLVHWCFWIFVGSTVWALKWNRYWGFFSCLALSFIWEVVERPLEINYPTRWQDPESWWNAWISDPLTCVVALLLIWFALDRRVRKPHG